MISFNNLWIFIWALFIFFQYSNCLEVDLLNTATATSNLEGWAINTYVKGLKSKSTLYGWKEISLNHANITHRGFRICPNYQNTFLQLKIRSWLFSPFIPVEGDAHRTYVDPFHLRAMQPKFDCETDPDHVTNMSVIGCGEFGEVYRGTLIKKVVASFVLQNELRQDIEEALRLLQEWNMEWKPSFFMTDKCDAEIAAIENCFSGCRVLICDFHREQAWLRWTRKTDNKVGAHREDLLALMRAVAKAESQDDYKTALGRLQRHAGWTSNVKFQKYFKNIWLDHKQRWLSLYRHDQLRVMINTNNGVERQNRLLKDTHLRHRTDKSLSGLITTLHEDFLPNSFLKYTQENAFSSERYRKYNEIIPTYLHNRPHQLVKHCMKRIRNAEDISASFVTENSTGFAVKSASNPSESYQVSFTNSNDFPKCSCEDFQRHFLPCKHMFAIFKHSPDTEWDSLPLWYRESPHMTLDQEVICGSVVQQKTQNTFINNPEQTQTNHFDNFGKDEECKDDINVFAKDIILTLVNESVRNVNCKTKAEAKTIIDEISSLAKQIHSAAFDVTTLKGLQEIRKNLRTVYETTIKLCDHDSGLRVACLPKKKSLKVKRKLSAFVCDQLPRKYAKRNPYASRVGKVASEMKRLHSVTAKTLRLLKSANFNTYYCKTTPLCVSRNYVIVNNVTLFVYSI